MPPARIGAAWDALKARNPVRADSAKGQVMTDKSDDLDKWIDAACEDDPIEFPEFIDEGIGAAALEKRDQAGARETREMASAGRFSKRRFGAV